MLHFLLLKLFPPASAPRRVSLILFWTLCLNLLFGSAFYLAESRAQPDLTLLDSIWWAMVTMATVGYGDFYAQTTVGRFLVSYPTFLLGIGLLGYFLGSVADAVLKGTSAHRKGLKAIMKTNHLIICGYPSTGKVLQIVRELRSVSTYGRTDMILVTSNITELPDELAAEGIRFVHGRPQSEDTLKKAGIENCGGVFVLAEDKDPESADAQTFAASAIIESIARESGRDIRVVCELIGRQNLKMMRRADTDGIVTHEGITDCLLVQEFLCPGMNEIFHQIITNQVGSQFYILKTRLHGKKIREVQIAALQHPGNIQIIGLIENGRYILNPSIHQTIGPTDSLIILADQPTDFEDVENSILRSSPGTN